MSNQAKKPAINIKARIQKYQEVSGSPPSSLSALPKSKSHNDMRAVTMMDEEGWLSAEVEYPHKPPLKPPDRKKKFTTENVGGMARSSPSHSPQQSRVNPPSPQMERNNPGQQQPLLPPSTPKKLASTDLFILPSNNTTKHFRPPPPKPPPPHLKPTKESPPPPNVKPTKEPTAVSSLKPTKESPPLSSSRPTKEPAPSSSLKPSKEFPSPSLKPSKESVPSPGLKPTTKESVKFVPGLEEVIDIDKNSQPQPAASKPTPILKPLPLVDNKPPKQPLENKATNIKSSPSLDIKKAKFEDQIDRKNSDPKSDTKSESSSLSDSVEEDKKSSGSARTPTISRSSFFGRFQRPSLSHAVSTETPFETSLELEESFDVIPDSTTNLEDMVLKMKEKDAKLHDANIYEVVQAVAREVPHCASTRDLPSSISDFPNGAREKVLHELYTTEYNYVKQLEAVVEVFKPQLSPLIGEEASQIFANVDDILAFNRGFLALLHSRFKIWHQTQSIVGDIFLGMFNQTHKSMYAIYCSNYDHAESMVLRLRKRKDIESQLQVCQNDSRIQAGLTLPMFLITPVQRVPRYILLLKDVIKRTEADHPDYGQLQRALDKMGELADYIDLQIKETQTKKTLQYLKKKVVGLSDLEQPNRSLVKEGQVYLQNIKKLYQCILFNDLLVFALGDSRYSTVQLQLNLEAVWVEDLEDRDPQTSSEDAIEIYTPQRPYRIYVRSNSEKKLWLPKLKETIYHHLMSTNQCNRNDRLDSTVRKANFIYADQRSYTGDFSDSLRHGKGTMIWPNHSQYIGDWVEDERCGEGEFRYNTGGTYNGRWREDKQNGFGALDYFTGDSYKGSWKDGLRQGKGTILYSNKDTFSGTFNLGHIEGAGILKCTNGVEYNGEWKASLRHGKGTLVTMTGDRYIGEFRNNQIHGNGKMLYFNGDEYDGSWKNGMRQGSGTFKSKTLGTYEGLWERNLRHGKGTMVYINRDKYEGFWEHDKHHGKGTLTFFTGEVYNGEFQFGLKHGQGEMIYNEKVTYTGGWYNGLRHGAGMMTYVDGSVYDGEWYMDLRHGQGIMTMRDNTTYSGQWEMDQPNGRGELNIPGANYKYNGDWVNGKREGRGVETANYGSYSGGWKGDMKHGHGEERTTVGTVFNGQWERGRKHGQGERKIAYGLIETQVWKSGQLQNDPLRMTAVELPYVSRNDIFM